GGDSSSKRAKVDQESGRSRRESNLVESSTSSREHNMASTSQETVASTSRVPSVARQQNLGVDQLPNEMREMRIRDEKTVSHDDKDPEATVINGNGTETGQIISTTVGGQNGQPKQAKCLETGEPVAIKKVLQDKRYKNRELQIMRVLDHPNVVRLKHSFFSSTEKDELYLNLVLEYVPET
ncbi:hypothetical protein Golax_023681, partial [Gossypium laxum]|nr:hypothetical protein [Gossypium laxum]